MSYSSSNYAALDLILERLELTKELAEDRRTVDLVGESDDRPDLRTLLNDYWEEIFEEELFGWSEDKAQWPAKRTRQMFDAWFDAALAESVIDLVPDDPLTEEDVDLADLEAALQTCAWCGLDLDPEQARMATFKLSDRNRFEHREGATLDLRIGRDRVVTGVVTPRDSEPARENADIIFPACSRRCEKHLLRSVPGALEEFEQRQRVDPADLA